MDRSNRRRKRNRIDIPRFFSLIIQSIKQLWAVSGGPYIITAVILILLAASFIFYDISSSSGRIHSGVSLAGFNVGSMTEKEAILALKQRVAANKNKPLQIQYKGKKSNIIATHVIKKIDYEKSIEKAYSFGRNAELFTKIYSRIRSYFRQNNIEPLYYFNESDLEAAIFDIAKGNHRPAKNASIMFKNGKARLDKAKDGFGVNIIKAEKSIVRALLNPDKVILRAEKLTPTINNNQAKDALPLARLTVSSNVNIIYGKQKWTLSKSDLITLFETKVEKERLISSLGQTATLQKIREFTANINRKPKDAKFVVLGTIASIIESSNGRKVDETNTYQNVIAASRSKTNRIAEVVVKETEPHRTTAKAKKMGIKELVSTFTTYYPAGKPRVKNIHLLADLLDGMLIAPGETFSFNGRIGQRTAERGFVAAPEIRDGEFVETIGGGICQVSTTTFNAALLAGIPIGKRNPHSLFIKKYPPGRDAAVSWPSPDLTFTNDTGNWILIKGGYTVSSISISFYGTDIGRKVSFETKQLGNIAYPTQGEKDPTLEKGKKAEKQKGVPGRKYLVIRTVKDKNGKVVRKTEIRSTFNPVPRIIRIGTKPEPKEKPKNEKSTDNGNPDNQDNQR